MALIVSPGPFPFQDGDRLVPSRDLQAFVAGTAISNLGPEEFASGNLTLPIASTEAPTTRTNGTLWFRRGVGRLYKWDIHPTGATNASWVAISERREMLVHFSGPSFEKQFLQLDTNISEFHSSEGRFGRQILNMSAGDAGVSNWPRGELVPPYGIALEDGAAGTFHVMVERGYVDAFVKGTGETGPSHVGLLEGNSTPELSVIADPYDGHAGDRTGVGWAVESNPTNAEQLTVFFVGPMNLVD